MQSKDLGKETDAAEEVLLETEWRVAACSGNGLILIFLQVDYPGERFGGRGEGTCRVTLALGFPIMFAVFCRLNGRVTTRGKIKPGRQPLSTELAIRLF